MCFYMHISIDKFNKENSDLREMKTKCPGVSLSLRSMSLGQIQTEHFQGFENLPTLLNPLLTITNSNSTSCLALEVTCTSILNGIANKQATLTFLFSAEKKKKQVFLTSNIHISNAHCVGCRPLLIQVTSCEKEERLSVIH